VEAIIHVVYKMELLLIEDPTDFKRGFSKIYKQTFDRAETKVGDSTTATGGIS
jgi:hypothetical protein